MFRTCDERAHGSSPWLTAAFIQRLNRDRPWHFRNSVSLWPLSASLTARCGNQCHRLETNQRRERLRQMIAAKSNFAARTNSEEQNFLPM
ncbi:hypothetical protein RHSP_82802 [Rhizobium freirei PRF 81]|uniref:Uncharacterized protein n=1 Tax=Rhizobium freirei PRF 81 TaxID=363754 RepID=N6U9P3_9HYPH|nr:hypothetical protein RHSP_82802 [Rhizobium freirei PRF 81]